MAATLSMASPVATQVTIFDQQGRLLQAALAAGPQPIDVSNRPAGLYFLQDAATGQRVRFEKAP
ncbi:MAG: T9SS type A sorting domain-containing protein [Janthinobacterium lividum]